MVAGIGHINIAFGVHRDAGRAIKLRVAAGRILFVAGNPVARQGFHFGNDVVDQGDDTN